MTEKRRAYESPADLLVPDRRDPNMPRPAAITVGAGLVWLRVAAGVLWLLSLWLRWPELVHDGWLGIVDEVGDPDAGLTAADAALWVVVVFGAAALLVDLALGVLIYRGVNWARVWVMAFSVLSISSAFVGWWVSGQEIHLETSLLTTALDVLVLLALSSRDAAAYARRGERD